jgi:hypothetical protein
MTVVINGTTGFTGPNTSNDILANGVTVGKGASAVATNTALGTAALPSNTTGAQNSASGYAALYSNTTGNANTATGYQALTTNTTGSNNTAVGQNALVFNTTASNNTAVGYQAGYSNTVGGNNFYGGYQAGNANTSGWYNTFIGHQAGLNSNVGGAAYDSKNTFIGWGSGSAVTTGVNNTILGAYNGNQYGLDIRTASDYIVLSTGAGVPSISTGTSRTIALEGTTPKSGSGITFAATQFASSDANTLDDYEEGTWTPTVTFGGGSAGQTYAYREGVYVKIGRLVTVSALFSITNNGSSTGDARLSGLPFSISNSGTGNFMGDGYTGTFAQIGMIFDSNNCFFAEQEGGTGSVGGWANINQSNFSGGGKFVSFSYLTSN